MSGPKVINIEALRREQERQAKRQLREAQLLTDEIMDMAAQLPASAEISQHANELLARLRESERKKDWAAVVEQGAGFVSFLEAELRKLSEEKRKARENQIQRETNLAAALRMLKTESRALGIPIPPTLENVRARLDSAAFASMEREVASRLEEIANRKCELDRKGEAARLNTIAESFKRGDERSLKIKSLLPPEDASALDSIERFQRVLSEIEPLLQPEVCLSFKQRFSALLARRPEGEILMLLDSLNLELAAEQRRVKELVESKAVFRTAQVLLAPFSEPTAAEFEQRIAHAQKAPTLIGARLLLNEVESWVAERRIQIDGAARRECVLGALAKLGYDVREGMAVAWASEGRIVVSKPADPDYGVEVVAPASGSSMQVRVVAFREGAAEGKTVLQRDKEVEESWCSDFRKLGDHLRAEGFDPRLQHASAPGEHALKAIGQKKTASLRAAESADKLRQRRM